MSRLPLRLVDNVGSPHLPPKNFVAVDAETAVGTLRVVGIVVRWREKTKFVEVLPEALDATVTEQSVVAGDFNLKIPGGPLSRRLETVLDAAGLRVVSGGPHRSLAKELPLIDHIAVTYSLTTSGLTVWPRRDTKFRGGKTPMSDHAGCSVVVTHR